MTIHLDHAATCFPKSEAVIDAVARCLRDVSGSPGRGGHGGAIAAARVVHEARERVAELFGVGDPARVVFTAGATMGVNVGLAGSLSPGDHLVTSDMEHNAVARPAQALAMRGVRVTRVAHEPDARRILDGLAAELTSATRAVVLNHASNVNGQALDLAAIGSWCRERGLVLGVDAAQTGGLLDVRVDDWGLGWVACSGHKGLGGPPGVGVLAVGPDTRLGPLITGGTGSVSESLEPPDFLPDALEAGTPNTPGIAGLAVAVTELLATGPATRLGHGLVLVDRLVDGLTRLDGVQVLAASTASLRVPVVSFTVPGVDPSSLAVALEEGGVRVRSGLHCAPLAHRRLGTFPEGTVRVSPGASSTAADIDACLAALTGLLA